MRRDLRVPSTSADRRLSRTSRIARTTENAATASQETTCGGLTRAAASEKEIQSGGASRAVRPAVRAAAPGGRGLRGRRGGTGVPAVVPRGDMAFVGDVDHHPRPKLQRVDVRSPRSDPRTCQSDSARPWRPGRTSAAPARRDSAPSTGRAGSQRRGRPPAPRRRYARGTRSVATSAGPRPGPRRQREEHLTTRRPIGGEAHDGPAHVIAPHPRPCRCRTTRWRVDPPRVGGWRRRAP